MYSGSEKLPHLTHHHLQGFHIPCFVHRTKGSVTSLGVVGWEGRGSSHILGGRNQKFRDFWNWGLVNLWGTPAWIDTNLWKAWESSDFLREPSGFAFFLCFNAMRTNGSEKSMGNQKFPINFRKVGCYESFGTQFYRSSECRRGYQIWGAKKKTIQFTNLWFSKFPNTRSMSCPLTFGSYLECPSVCNFQAA